MRKSSVRSRRDAASWSKASLRVVPANSYRRRQQFIKVPWTLYGDDPAWVPPLLAERRLHLSQHNAFFEHARVQLWVAYRDNHPVGRISAQVDELHLAQYDDATGYFGMIEAVDNAETFQGLLGAAEGWLRQQGLRRALGPFNFSINEECGLLVDGFEEPPMFLMSHAKPYYDGRIREQKYRKAKDTIAYLMDANVCVPAVMAAVLRRTEPGKIHLRPIRVSHLREDLAILREIFNDAWSRNWNFVPFTEAEMQALGRSLRLFVPPEFVQIAYVDSQPAAMIVAVPNVNESIRDLGGRLLPTGWARLLWRLKKAWPRTARVPLMGVRRKYHRSALGMALVFHLIEAVRRSLVPRGIRQIELSWILEDNLPMRRILERMGAHPYKTYRIYEKALV